MDIKMDEGISDYTKFCVDLRRHMWMAGVETELRRLIWQIAVTGKYISAKIHESNRKLAGFKNIYGEEQLALDKSSDQILIQKGQAPVRRINPAIRAPS
jgi:fructose-1,6-bisphosphatase I